METDNGNGSDNGFSPVGWLVLLDLSGVEFELLNDPLLLCGLASQAAEKAGMHVLATTNVPFRPQGLSLAVILGESHLTIHTYPEHGYAAVDVFTCGGGNPLMAAEYICTHLKPKHFCLQEFRRGINTKSLAGRI